MHSFVIKSSAVRQSLADMAILSEVRSHSQSHHQFSYIIKYMDRNDPTEILYIKLCKRALGVHLKATNMAVYAELGRYPLFVDQLVQLLNIWITSKMRLRIHS